MTGAGDDYLRLAENADATATRMISGDGSQNDEGPSRD
jgi:hypothetical protein